MKYFKISELIYLVIAVLSIIKVFTDWNIDRESTYKFIFFGAVSLFMFFFRRHFRKKFNQRKDEQ